MEEKIRNEFFTAHGTKDKDRVNKLIELLISEYNDVEHIDLSNTLECFGIKLASQDLGEDLLSYCISNDENLIRKYNVRCAIVTNSRLPYTMQRFIAAMEFGHLLLDSSSRDSFYHENYDLDRDVEADYYDFARKILMPESTFREQCGIVDKAETNNKLFYLSSYFRVPIDEAYVRYGELIEDKGLKLVSAYHKGIKKKVDKSVDK